MRQLVFADGHDVALAEKDVTRLVHGVGQKQARERVPRRLLLGFHRGVALELGFGAKREEGEHELVQCGNVRMREDDGLLGVDSAGQVIDHHVVHVVGDVGGRVAVGDHLIVGDDDAGGDAEVLQRHAFPDRAEVVSQMQAARGSVAGEHKVFLGMHGQVGADFVTALLRCEEAIFVAHGFFSP